MKKLWMTSSDAMISFTGRPTGTCSSLISRAPSHVLQLPHPLLADDVDFHRARGRTGHVEEDLRAPDEHHHRDAERDERPDSSSGIEPWMASPTSSVVLAVVLDREDDDQHRDQQGEERRHGDEKEVQRVDLRRLLGRLLRKEWKVLKHRLDTVRDVGLGRVARVLRLTNRNVRNPSTVRSRRRCGRRRSIAPPYLPGRRVVVIAEQQHLVGDRAEPVLGRLDERQAQIPRRKVDAEEIARDDALRRRDVDRRAVGVLLDVLVERVTESDGRRPAS